MGPVPVAPSLARSALGAMVGFAVTPFVMTGLFRLMPALPIWPTFMAVLAAAIVLAVFRPMLRGVAAGIACAVVVEAAFFVWLFHAWRDLQHL